MVDGVDVCEEGKMIEGTAEIKVLSKSDSEITRVELRDIPDGTAFYASVINKGPRYLYMKFGGAVFCPSENPHWIVLSGGIPFFGVMVVKNLVIDARGE